MKTIVLTGGGTAGHVTPNIALLPYLKKEGFNVYYIGSENGMEREIVARYGIEYYPVSSGKLRRYFDTKNFSDIFRVIKGIFQAKKIIKKLKPDIVFSKGGFVAVPVVIGAKMNGVPVVCHESDMTPGLANKLAMPFAKAVCTTFPETAKLIKGGKGVHTGTPIRDVLFKGDKSRGLEMCAFFDNKPVILVMGGSQGSVAVNGTIRDILDKLLEKYNVIHLCGKGNLDRSLEQKRGYCQFEYISKELPDLFAASDLIVTRAGSNAICEFLALKKPMLLVPLPLSVSRGDQILNAKNYKKAGFADVIFEEEITQEAMLEKINDLYTKKEEYIERMSASAASKGTENVLKVIKSYTEEKQK
ncbi:MAG TPA: undecaprenyldiphospho-muramoylpentapeptide beta-N-acetylglucosaminyltransferase [Lachnospiraceae bacterium]|nr:undecaprenyldiphospho-muramoylpentapeptide beta-N-acetylglucosaminyltransferase [Lachnospiraceae bacterium]